MMRVAVTGGICDGKSVVTSFFGSHGAVTLSADAVARSLLSPGTALWTKVQSTFPASFAHPDQKTIRRSLAETIARDQSARRKLNRLLHPAIMSELLRLTHDVAASDSTAVVVAEIPLLIEIGAQGLFDRIVVARAGADLQLERLTARLGDRDYAVHCLATQLPTKAKAAFADWIVPTDGSLEDTARFVCRIWALLAR